MTGISNTYTHGIVPDELGQTLKNAEVKEIDKETDKIEMELPWRELEQIASKGDNIDKIMDVVCVGCPLYNQWIYRRVFCEWALCHCG